MSTIGDLVNRTLLALEPPDMQPALCFLSSGVDDDDTSFVLSGFDVPEDERLMRAGVLLESPGGEIARVTAYDEITLTCTVERAEFGEAAAIAAGAHLKLAPPFPRVSVFQAVADNILSLYPSLYTVRNVNLATIGGVYAPIEDPLAVDVIEVTDGILGQESQLDGRIVDYHHQTGGRTLVVSDVVGEVWLRYRRRFASVTSEADTLEDIGLDERWAFLVLLGACADLIVTRDLSEQQTNWVGQLVKAQNIRIGQRTGLAAALRNYQDVLVQAASKEMDTEYQPRIHVVQTGIGW